MSKVLGLSIGAALVIALAPAALAMPSSSASTWQPAVTSNSKSSTAPQQKAAQQLAAQATTQQPAHAVIYYSPYGYAKLDHAPGD